MKQFIDFYMVVISPWCYLGLNRLISISKTYDIRINIKPIDIFAIFKENGTKGVKDRPLPVQINRINELKRWGNYLNIKINEKPKFHPVDPDISSKVIIASLLFDNDLEKTFTLTKNLCEAVWVKNLNISDEIVINKICEHLDLNNKTKTLYNKDEAILEILKNNTLDAKNNNVFGVPTFLYKNELFFGQDRMFMLEQSIKTNT
ncbi:MAG: disulfide bond formation protein DsbA [Rickettsiales bacterium]|nr:disulfide bond formation protein DsbA [Rickettsiales bacterium]OUV78977.1 MAG: hypothetical protein CBC91_04500 [Rickettsiales bacterium TMED131]|tara:strand:+ start:54 stop:665 length:612 start_codon:yes stop_codon:yes gene_type:complete